MLSNLVLDELDQELERRGHRFCRYADDCNIYVRSHRAGDRVMSSVCRFVTTQLRLKVNVSKSAVARPEERKFLGFRITNDGRQRQIAPQALDRFKMRIRELTRRKLGVSLPSNSWRHTSSGGAATSASVTLPECSPTWTRGFAGDSGCTSGGSGSLGGTASRNCGDEASPSSTQQSPQGHRPGSGGCPATRPSSKPCAIAISTRSAFRDSLRLPMHNPIEPPWYVTRMPGGVTGKAREGLPMSILAERCRASFEASRGSDDALELVLAAATGYGFFSVWFAVFDRHVDVKLALIDAFPGTAASCFGQDANLINRPGAAL